MEQWTPWPLEKLAAAMSEQGEEHRESNATGRSFAVLLTTGAMNPVHRGHVQMLHQARARLEECNFNVLTAFLSPSHDAYVQPKAASLKTIGLPAAKRLELAHLTVLSDSFVSVGAWEASRPGRWPDFPEVIEALQKRLHDSPFGERLARSGGLTSSVPLVFYVCGSDHANKCNLYSGLGERAGVVVVPRSGDVVRCENPAKLVFVAEPAAHESLSSTAVRKAMQDGNSAFLTEAMSPEAAECLLACEEAEPLR